MYSKTMVKHPVFLFPKWWKICLFCSHTVITMSCQCPMLPEAPAQYIVNCKVCSSTKETQLCRVQDTAPAFMKQQGFHVSQAAQWAAKPSEAQLSSSQASASSKLADGLQGLLEMCNAGSLTNVTQQSSVGILTCYILSLAIAGQHLGSA